MKHTIGGIIEKALEDRDLWVTLVANMVKNYPTTVTLNLDLSGNQIAENVVEDISTKGLHLKQQQHQFDETCCS